LIEAGKQLCKLQWHFFKFIFLSELTFLKSIYHMLNH